MKFNVNKVEIISFLSDLSFILLIVVLLTSKVWHEILVVLASSKVVYFN